MKKAVELDDSLFRGRQIKVCDECVKDLGLLLSFQWLLGWSLHIGELEPTSANISDIKRTFFPVDNLSLVGTEQLHVTHGDMPASFPGSPHVRTKKDCKRQKAG